MLHVGGPLLHVYDIIKLSNERHFAIILTYKKIKK